VIDTLFGLSVGAICHFTDCKFFHAAWTFSDMVGLTLLEWPTRYVSSYFGWGVRPQLISLTMTQWSLSYTRQQCNIHSGLPEVINIHTTILKVHQTLKNLVKTSLHRFLPLITSPWQGKIISISRASILSTNMSYRARFVPVRPGMKQTIIIDS